jgi:hypothetical protein
MKKQLFNTDATALTSRLVIRLLIGHWKKTCIEWYEQSCPDTAYDTQGQAFLAFEDLLLSGIETDVSEEIYGALFAVYLAFGIVGYDAFSEYVQQTVQLGLRRWKKVCAIDRIQLTVEHMALLEEVLSFVQLPLPKEPLFVFVAVEKKKPEGFAAIEKEYDVYMESISQQKPK